MNHIQYGFCQQRQVNSSHQNLRAFCLQLFHADSLGPMCFVVVTEILIILLTHLHVWLCLPIAILLTNHFPHIPKMFVV